jgi:S-adenosylmethionine synthetase
MDGPGIRARAAETVLDKATEEATADAAYERFVENNLRRNYAAHYIHGMLGMTGFRLVNTPTFVPAYLHSISGSDVWVGIGTSLTEATSQSGDQGAGDQGIMFGYATDESPEMMPLPILLAHKLMKLMADDRKGGNAKYAFLRPDSKSQVSLLYDGNEPKDVTAVVISTQHTPDADQKKITEYVREELGPKALGSWWNKKLTLFVNPTGSFVHGGPSADAGVTGRKIIVDSYGGWGRHGGGAFSGKDPSKVDRSSAYFCRYAAKQIVAAGFAKRAEIQVGYAIGMAKPVSVKVDTFGTGDERAAEEFLMNAFDFRPRAIIEKLDLLRPIYRQTTNYGHFGRPGLPWEAVEKAAAVAKELLAIMSPGRLAPRRPFG